MKKSILILSASFVLGIALLLSLMGQDAKKESKTDGVFVDSTKNNGSFETGKINPWAPVSILVSTMDSGQANDKNIIKVVEDPAFASNGKFYLSLQSAGDPKGKLVCARIDLRNIQGIDLEKGRTFILSWDIRNGEKAFSTPIVEFLALTKTGAVMAKQEPLTKDPAVSDKWVKRTIKLVMPDTLKEFDSIHLRIGYAHQPTEAGDVYVGYIDNITLAQVK